MLKKNNQTSYDSHPDLPLDPDAAEPGIYKWPLHLTPSLQLAVFIGGCLGTLARYGITIAIPAQGSGWPLATFITNLLGAFMLGLLLQMLLHYGKDKGKLRFLRLGAGTGFVGAFTTYSSLAVETDLLSKSNHLGIAAFYAGISVIGGIIFSAIGVQVATNCHKQRTRNNS